MKADTRAVACFVKSLHLGLNRQRLVTHDRPRGPYDARGPAYARGRQSLERGQPFGRAQGVKRGECGTESGIALRKFFRREVGDSRADDGLKEQRTVLVRVRERAGGAECRAPRA